VGIKRRLAGGEVVEKGGKVSSSKLRAATCVDTVACSSSPFTATAPAAPSFASLPLLPLLPRRPCRRRLRRARHQGHMHALPRAPHQP
jgi:hypothetical protein